MCVVTRAPTDSESETDGENGQLPGANGKAAELTSPILKDDDFWLPLSCEGLSGEPEPRKTEENEYARKSGELASDGVEANVLIWTALRRTPPIERQTVGVSRRCAFCCMIALTRRLLVIRI